MVAGQPLSNKIMCEKVYLVKSIAQRPASSDVSEQYEIQRRRYNESSSDQHLGQVNCMSERP